MNKNENTNLNQQASPEDIPTEAPAKAAVPPNSANNQTDKISESAATDSSDKTLTENEHGDNAAEDKPTDETADAEPDGEKLPISEETADEVPQESKTPVFKVILAKIKKFFIECGTPDILFLRFIGVYFIVSSINFISAKNVMLSAITNWREYITQINGLTTVLWIVAGFVFLTIIHLIINKRFRVFDQLAAFAGTIMFALTVVYRSSLLTTPLFYLSIGLIGVSCVFIAYSVGKIRRTTFEKLPTWVSALIVGTAALSVMTFVIVTTVSHNRVFSTSCFDFGIFVQMFHSMSSDLTAVTTCERDEFLSHFCVHASFIYYLLAPIYYLFPKTDTLLIAQAVLAMGGVIPLFLIAKKHGYKGFPLVFVSLIYVFCDGILAPCYYDFHENAFLPTLLMWLLYAVDTKKYTLFYIMSALTCIVKEDAPLYVICIALYFFFEDNKTLKRIHSLVVTGLSTAYFMFITNWLAENGDGQMMTSSRFGSLTIDSSEGFVGIAKNVLLDPAYFFSQFVSRREGANFPEEMIIFILQVTLPLLFLPFFTNKIRRFLLVVPFIIMNLVIGSGYGYASSIGYQYIFGPSCLLVYLVVVNCADFRPAKRNSFVTCAAAASLIMSTALISPNMSYYDQYTDKKEEFDEIIEVFEDIPEDARIAANTWYLPHLANRDEIYILDNGDFSIDEYNEDNTFLTEPDRYDMFVMSAYDTHTGAAIKQLTANGFVLYDEINNSAGNIIIYTRPEFAKSE